MMVGGGKFKSICIDGFEYVRPIMNINIQIPKSGVVNVEWIDYQDQWGYVEREYYLTDYPNRNYPGQNVINFEDYFYSITHMRDRTINDILAE